MQKRWTFGSSTSLLFTTTKVADKRQILRVSQLHSEEFLWGEGGKYIKTLLFRIAKNREEIHMTTEKPEKSCRLSISIALLVPLIQAALRHGPLLLDGLLGAEMMNLLKIRIFLKSSFGVNVKVHISHQKKFCKAMFIHFRFIVSQSL